MILKKIFQRQLLVLFFGLGLSTPTLTNQVALAQMQDTMTVTIEGQSTVEEPGKAKQEAVKDALDRAAVQEVTSLIGLAKLEKNRPAINAKILSQSGKFILNYKAGEATTKDGQTTVPVTMKINYKTLRDMLAREGFMYQSEGPATILPVIQVVEHKDSGRSYRWWIEEQNPQNAFLRDILKQVLKQFDAVFRAKGFSLIDPVSQHYVQMVPDAYRNTNLTLDDLLFLGQFFKAQMVIQGEVTFEPLPNRPRVAQMDVKLSAYHTTNGRLVGEVSRIFESTPGDWEPSVEQVTKKGFEEVTQDLSAQIFEQWARGSFGASLVRIRMMGSLGYRDIEAFKKQASQLIPDIKTLRERKMESGMVIFEADAAGGTINLVKRLEQAPFSGYSASVSNVVTSQLDLRWRKR